MLKSSLCMEIFKDTCAVHRMESIMKDIKLVEKLGFCTFSLANNVVYQFKSIYYLFFLTNVLKINILVAGTILTIGTVWDAFNDPLIGFWAVNKKFKNGERVRPFALWFTIPWAVSVVLLFADFNTSGAITVLISLALYLLFETFYTCIDIPYNSMAGLATSSDTQRKSINMYRNIGATLGSGIGAVSCLPLLQLFGAIGSDGNLVDEAAPSGFLYTAIIMGAICIIGGYIHYFTSTERVKPISLKEEKLSARAVFGMLAKSKPWLLNTVYFSLYGVTNLLLMSSVTYYATYVLGQTSAATPIQAAYLVAALFTSFAVPHIDKRLGRRRTMILGAIIAVVGKVWFVLSPFSLAAIYTNAITVGISTTIAFIMFNTNRATIVDLIEWKNGKRLDSMVSTADSFASKLASAGATQLIAVSLAIAGFDAAIGGAQPDSAINMINNMLGIVPFILSVAMLITVYFLNIDKDRKRMRAEKKKMKLI